MSVYYSDDQVTLYHGDCVEVMAGMDAASVDAVVTDPPYGLEFMGKDWDAPWKYGFSETGYSDSKRMARPNFGSTRNPMCRSCRKHQRGRDRCVCEQPDFDERPADSNVAFQQWCQRWAAECLRVLKPGGHLLAFGGTRTWHRLACAIEDAGFEIRDSIAWIYGSGFPKSLDVSKAIDKAARGVPQGGADPTSPNHGKHRTTTTEGKRWDGDSGQGYGAGDSRFLVDGAASGSGTGRAESGAAETACEAARQWKGWGTALKPAHEPIVVARKPLAGTVAANVLEHGTGALNIDGCRVPSDDGFEKAWDRPVSTSRASVVVGRLAGDKGRKMVDLSANKPEGGRWPTNVVLDEAAAAEVDRQSGISTSRAGKRNAPKDAGVFGAYAGNDPDRMGHADSGGASRFFPVFRYEAKADSSERPSVNGVQHPTVKPLELMRWLVRLVTPPGGVVLDPFAGSGTTAEACIHEHKRCIAIEREAGYLPLITARLTKPMEIGFDFGEEDR